MLNACGWVEFNPTLSGMSSVWCPSSSPSALWHERLYLSAWEGRHTTCSGQFSQALGPRIHSPHIFISTAPKEACQLVYAGTDSADKPQAGYSHQALLGWVTGFSSFVGQVILARSCQFVDGVVLVSSYGVLGEEMPVLFTERRAVTTREMEIAWGEVMMRWSLVGKWGKKKNEAQRWCVGASRKG